MKVEYAALKARSVEASAVLAGARSARNLSSRRKREQQIEDQASRRRKARSEAELDRLLNQRLVIRVPEADRPGTKNRTPRRLFTRAVDQMLMGTTGMSNARGPDGCHSIHYAFTARGFGSTKGRRWRAGEAVRAALYSVREEALEDGELGWWSNIAADRNELVAHYRALEMLEAHDRANANVYIVEVIALPAELNASERRDAAKRICAELEKQGLGYTVGLHLPDAAGDQRNYHLHLVYSMRPCARIGTCEWSFGAAKRTEINTPKGIVTRRRAVVDAVNATLAEARIDKRYTAQSNRERGMAAPARGKVGQVETALARRLAALEAREAQLAALRDHARWIRQTLLDAAERLKAARQKTMRRLAQAAIGLAQDEAERIQPAELRTGVGRALEHTCDVVDRTSAAADNQLVTAHRAVRDRLRLAVRQIPIPPAGTALADRRNVVIHRLVTAAMDANDTIRRVQADLDRARIQMAENRAADRMPQSRDPTSAADVPAAATVLPPGQAPDTAPAKRGIAGQAAGITQTGSLREIKLKGRNTDLIDTGVSPGKRGHER
ncbi:MobA/MobL family protein [Sphingomonas sp. TX0543]|uniref:MobA/MobL family protein n=1 Tax=unclassified Sphingomonas TaxID=196159 RepID=UPI0010F72CD4|nr:MobA/MobL family protein [Sphingomonas sp. 3P27F8]